MKVNGLRPIPVHLLAAGVHDPAQPVHLFAAAGAPLRRRRPRNPTQPAHEIPAQPGARPTGEGAKRNHPVSRATLFVVGTLTGRVHGNTIDLDAVPSAPFEGKRVRVVLELVDDDVLLSTAEQGLAWNAWVTQGPDGAIEDDGEPEFPRRHPLVSLW